MKESLYQTPALTFDELCSVLAACKFFSRFKGKREEYEPIYNKLREAEVLDIDAMEADYIRRYYPL